MQHLGKLLFVLSLFFQSESNSKEDCFCFFTNNSSKASLFSAHNGSILQHGKTRLLYKEKAETPVSAAASPPNHIGLHSVP